MQKSKAIKEGSFEINGRVDWALIVLAVLLASSQTTLADPTTLVCSTGESSPTTFDLDEAKGTVTINNPAVRHSDMSFTIPASSVTYTARFDQKTIVVEIYDSTHQTFTINRMTGIVGVDGTYPNGGETYHADWPCHVGKAQF